MSNVRAKERERNDKQNTAQRAPEGEAFEHDDSLQLSGVPQSSGGGSILATPHPSRHGGERTLDVVVGQTRMTPKVVVECGSERVR